ncbi:MAG: glycosyltransferase [Planctomycetota bacterium]
MTAPPIVSVVMPVLATPPEMLREAIESILAQTLGNLELIIVEDPSQTVRRDIILSFDDDRIRYTLNPQRSGLVAQRNLGLQQARGEFIVKADSDDVSEPDRCALQVDFLRSNEDIGVVGSWLSIIDHDGTKTGRREYPTEAEAIHRMFRRRNPIAQPAACFRKQLFDQFGGYLDGYPVCQDYAYWSHLAKNGVRFANLPQCLVRYRQHAQSIKTTKLRQTLDATIQIKETYWAGEMNTVDRLRVLAERILRYAPGSVTQSLFQRLTYRRSS